MTIKCKNFDSLSLFLAFPTTSGRKTQPESAAGSGAAIPSMPTVSMHNPFIHTSGDEVAGDLPHTAREIGLQPESWNRVWRGLRDRRQEMSSFLQPVLGRGDLQIVLTGAGSSAFAGEVAADAWRRHTGRSVRPIPTTDLVTHARELLLPDAPLLLISLARSGNSPESMGAVERAEQHVGEVFHLAITCNPDGGLAGLSGRSNALVHLLPPETEDRSLAMTNSFSSLGLAASLIPVLTGAADGTDEAVRSMSHAGEQILAEGAETCRKLGGRDFRRIIFLGSGPLLAIARESHLKVQELTNGEIVGKFDSFLGFRHGPKAVIDKHTLLVYLFSNRAGVRRYEHDLVRQVAGHGVPVTTLGVGDAGDAGRYLDHRIGADVETDALPEALWALLGVLPGQMIGYFASLDRGLHPDNPSPEGTIARVVEGVTLYDDESNP